MTAPIKTATAARLPDPGHGAGPADDDAALPEGGSELESGTSSQGIAAWARTLEDRSAQEVLDWALERWSGSIALCTSFQAEGMVILDLAHRLTPDLRVLTLDTGRLPRETYDHIERVRSHYGIEVELVFPNAADVEAMVRQGGPNLFYRSLEDRQLCCRVRKVEPLRRALESFDAWIAGLRRGQTDQRSSIAKLECDRVNRPGGGLVKVNPLADWTHARVWSYIREHRVPYHPLYDRGYLSIGCSPCTRASRPEEDPRAGRWWWERTDSRECGLHVIHGGAR